MHRELFAHIRSLTRGAAVAASCLFAVGCGPTVKSQLPPGASMPASLALLPPDYSGEIPRERVSLVRQAIINQLRNKDFVVLDDQAVSSVCSSPACPEREALAKKYLVDGFATLTLTSFSRNNFFAGYYNELSGDLAVVDRSGRELIKVADTQNEEGGLLLQSGQVFQAIISSVKNTGDEVFDKLADKFAHTVVEQLPAPAAPANRLTQEGLTVALTTASASWTSPKAYQVCAKGTPNSFAYLLSGKNRSNLREVSPGSYCANFSALVTEDAAHNASIELRSAFGTSVRQDVSLPVAPPCDLRSRVESTDGKVRLICTQVGSASPSGCSGSLMPCSAQKVVLFAAASPTGPFQKIGEASSISASVPASAQNVHVLAVGAGGIASLPVKADSTQEQRP